MVALALMIIGLFFARRRLGLRFRARNIVERFLDGFMIACAVVAVLTTAGIVVSLVYEASAFFRLVPIFDFFARFTVAGAVVSVRP